MMSRRVFLVAAAAVFFGWLAWLGVAALGKNRGPVVSRAQAAGATHPVVAALTGDPAPDREATVTEPLTPAGPAAGATVAVGRLSEAAGYTGPGEYLLLLTKDATGDGYAVAGRQRSPGYEGGAAEGQVVYRWTPAVRAQAKNLFP